MTRLILSCLSYNYYLELLEFNFTFHGKIGILIMSYKLNYLNGLGSKYIIKKLLSKTKEIYCPEKLMDKKINNKRQ